MLKSNYTPSVNIIRDAQKEMEYIVTENAEQSALNILNDFHKGFHSFSIIGSYGTGKSSFLWALEKTLSQEKKIFDLKLSKRISNVHIINIVGGYESIINVFNESFDIAEDFSSNQKLFDRIYQEYVQKGDDTLLLIAIDEFGKFLEYAAQHNPEKEMYFIQQLAEFVNDPSRNIILLTTLHQGIDTYSTQLSDVQKNEWRKVKGRFKEVPFNEPVEQLLTLASNFFTEQAEERKETKYTKSLVSLQKHHNIFPVEYSYFDRLKNLLYPMDVFAAYTLTLSLQKYGQNERSLFSFLQSSDQYWLDKNQYFSIASVYDYLFANYYPLLSSQANPDYANWNAIKNALQRAEVIVGIDLKVAEQLLKTIGLLQIFASKGANIDRSFLHDYFSNHVSNNILEETFLKLTKHQIIRYFQFNSSYKLFEGTDLDIEGALIKAENQVSEEINLVAKLKSSFSFPVVNAKANSYQTGTPRLFEFLLTEKPTNELPSAEIDGFINLIFNTSFSEEKLVEYSLNQDKAILYAYFNNSSKISAALFEIEKTDQVLKNIEGEGDRVAIRELQSIKKSNVTLLNHYVMDALFNKKEVLWIYKGELLNIESSKSLNKKLSEICFDVYDKAPVIKNELFNKHKVSSAISSARKNYFAALVNYYTEPDLGFDTNKFPPEKTIYYTLLKRSGMHVKGESAYTLKAPEVGTELYKIWELCETFLSSAIEDQKPLSYLIDKLTSSPYKLKQGVIDFWVPTFLFIRKGDYALYAEGTFKPYINEQELYLITRNPHHYTVKSFELNNLRLSFFNRYREVLEQDDSNKLTVNSFIESIRPILLTYKGLNDYAKHTKRLSKEAIALRETIRFAQDPEKVFFDEFPKALGFDVTALLKSEQNFDDYIYKFQYSLDEIKNAYANLLDRLEQFIQEEIIGEKYDFKKYKKHLVERFKSLKEHQLLSKQKTFLQRINSPLNDRDSWLASIGQILIGKPLHSIDDQSEYKLQDNLKHFITEMDNLIELSEIKYDKEKEEIFKLDFTSVDNGLIPYVLRISKGKLNQASDSIKDIQGKLGTDKQIRIAILAKLLKEELEKND